MDHLQSLLNPLENDCQSPCFNYLSKRTGYYDMPTLYIKMVQKQTHFTARSALIGRWCYAVNITRWLKSEFNLEYMGWWDIMMEHPSKKSDFRTCFCWKRIITTGPEHKRDTCEYSSKIASCISTLLSRQPINVHGFVTILSGGLLIQYICISPLW